MRLPSRPCRGVRPAGLRSGQRSGAQERRPRAGGEGPRQRGGGRERQLHRPRARASGRDRRARDRRHEERVRLHGEPRAPNAADVDQGLRRPDPGRQRRGHQRDPGGVPRHRQGELRPACGAHQRDARHLAHRVRARAPEGRAARSAPSPSTGAVDTFRAVLSQTDRTIDVQGARAPAARGRRSRPRGPGAHQPHQQRDQVLAGRRPGLHHRAPFRRVRGRLGHRPGPRYQPRRPEAAVHQVLPSRHGHDARDRRHRPGALDLQDDHRAARRRDRLHEQARHRARRSGSACRSHRTRWCGLRRSKGRTRWAARCS